MVVVWLLGKLFFGVYVDSYVASCIACCADSRVGHLIMKFINMGRIFYLGKQQEVKSIVMLSNSVYEGILKNKSFW